MFTARPAPAMAPGDESWRRMLTASKVPAMLGLSPYESRFSLWHRMAGNIEWPPGNSSTEFGQFIEYGLGVYAQQRHPEWRLRFGGSWVSLSNERFAAAPDRLAYMQQPYRGSRWRGVEIKTARYGDEWGTPGTDQIPPGYRSQVMWQMHVLGLPVTTVIAAVDFSIREYVIDYDASEGAFIESQAVKFLASLDEGRAPAIDEHSQTYEAIRKLHPLIDGTTVSIPVSDARDFVEAERVFSLAEDARTLWRSLIAAQMGSAREARCGGYKLARRQAKGDGTPFLVAQRTLPTPEQLDELEMSTA